MNLKDDWLIIFFFCHNTDFYSCIGLDTKVYVCIILQNKCVST